MDLATARFTDRMALLFEEEAQPPIAGRLFGLLLISDHQRSLGSLAAALGVSKASVSTNARLLAQLGVVERVRRNGDRRDYYRVAPDLFERTMAQRLGRWQGFTEALADARRTLPALSAGVNARLQGYETAYSYLAHAIRRALATRQRRAPARRPARVASR